MDLVEEAEDKEGMAVDMVVVAEVGHTTRKMEDEVPTIAKIRARHNVTIAKSMVIMPLNAKIQDAKETTRTTLFRIVMTMNQHSS